MIARRQILMALGATVFAAVLPASAQQQSRLRRIGFFAGGTPQSSADFLTAFHQGMLELRWKEGHDYRVDAEYANGDSKALPGLAEKLVASRPELILTTSDGPAVVLAQKTKTIPVVFSVTSDPVGNRMAASLRRPGANLTGLTSLSSEVAEKRLQLIHEAFPRISHVAVLFLPSAESVSQAKGSEEAGKKIRFRITAIEVRERADIELAFRRGASLGVQAYFVATGPLFNANRKLLIELASQSKLPAAYSVGEFVDEGGLLSYGPSFKDNFRRAAGYVDKILKGATPGELPIEQPLKFELAVNLKTAKAMGLAIPQSVLLQADRVIE